MARLASSRATASGGAIVPARGNAFTLEEAIAARTAAIHKAGRGTLFKYADGSTTPVSGMKAEEFASALAEGACWLDERRPSKPAVARVTGSPAATATAFTAGLSRPVR